MICSWDRRRVGAYIKEVDFDPYTGFISLQFKSRFKSCLWLQWGVSLWFDRGMYRQSKESCFGILRMAITIIAALIVSFVSVVSVLLWKSFMLAPSVRLPPGPRPLPIVGNLLMMRKYESIPDFALEMKRKYGPIITVWRGSKPVVIISGPDIIHEAMIKQGGIFNARTILPSLRVLTSNFRGLIWSNTERQRFLRKLVTTQILSKTRIAGFRPIRHREVNILTESLKKTHQIGADARGGTSVTNFRSLMRMAICNMLMGVFFGRRLTTEEYSDLDEVMVKRFSLAAGNPRDFIPLLAWLPDRKIVKMEQAQWIKMWQIFRPLIEERKQILKSGKLEESTFVDTLLRLQSGGKQSPIEILDSDIVLLCTEFLGAGTDTTALNLEYCIANLINRPSIQEKLAAEIFAVAGERLVEEDDFPRLPYLDAVIKETLRRHSPARLALSRQPLSSTKVAGYDIPAGTTVLQHIDAVSLNPDIWDDPLEFRPERFFNKTVDITGSTEISMIPFGVGRRMCPAVNIAFLHEQLVLARLIQAYEWKSASPGQLLDLSPARGITSPMKYPLVASIQERSRVC